MHYNYAGLSMYIEDVNKSTCYEHKLLAVLLLSVPREGCDEGWKHLIPESWGSAVWNRWTQRRDDALKVREVSGLG